MDFMTILGLILGLGAVWWVLWSGDIIYLLFNVNAAVLVFGGVLGAILITSPWRIIKKIPRVILLVFFPKRLDKLSRITEIFEELSRKIHKTGISSSLLAEIPQDNPFFVRAIKLFVDGYDRDFIHKNLANEISCLRSRHSEIHEVFRMMGAYAPIFGLLGTLIGVVQVLQNLSDPQSMGASMAIAITTTFYGIFSTNFLFLPIAGKLSSQTEREILNMRLILEGVLSLKDGDIPVVLREKLSSFLANNERRK